MKQGTLFALILSARVRKLSYVHICKCYHGILLIYNVIYLSRHVGIELCMYVAQECALCIVE